MLLKATGGGGGIGIYLCHSNEDLSKNFETAGRSAYAHSASAAVHALLLGRRAVHMAALEYTSGTSIRPS